MLCGRHDARHDGFGLYLLHAGIVAVYAGLVAVDAARTAVHVELHGVVLALPPAHEAGVGMGGAPDAHHRGGYERSQVHVGRVHRNHHIEHAHQRELLAESLDHGRCHGAAGSLLGDVVELFGLRLSASEEEYAVVGVLLGEQGDHLLHQSQWIYLALMGCKGRYAYPALVLGLVAYPLRTVCRRRFAVGIEGGEVGLDGIAQLGEHIGVVLERRGLLHALFPLLLSEQTLAAAVLVYMRHVETPHAEAQTQILGAQDVVEIGDSGEVLGYKSAVEAIEAMQIVQLFGRGFHEPDIGREVVKEGARKRSAQHRDVGVRVLGGERIDYRHGHRHVAHR